MEMALLIITGIMVALVTGFIFAYEISINVALRQQSDAAYLQFMQAVNRVVEKSGPFLLSFMLPIVLLPYITFTYGGGVGTLKFMLLLGATIAYLVGPIGISFGGNIPLNKRLDTVDLSDAAAARKWYAEPWNRLNTVRNLLSIAAIGLLLAAYLV